MDETWCDPPNCGRELYVVYLSCHVIDTCHRPTEKYQSSVFTFSILRLDNTTLEHSTKSTRPEAHQSTLDIATKSVLLLMRTSVTSTG